MFRYLTLSMRLMTLVYTLQHPPSVVLQCVREDALTGLPKLSTYSPLFPRFVRVLKTRRMIKNSVSLSPQPRGKALILLTRLGKLRRVPSRSA